MAKRTADGRLHRVHRGVYAVAGRRLSGEGRWLAATLACGPKALLSHRSAAELWGIHRSAKADIDVTLPSASVRARAGIEVHGSLTITHRDRAQVDAIPCTSVARTLVDLGDVASGRAVERAVDQAEVLRLFHLRAIEEVLERVGPRRGAGRLRAVLRDLAEPTLTESEFEERFLALCRSAGLPAPSVNAWIALGRGVAYKVDFLWRRQRLALETDGRRYHSSRRSFEGDRLRDQRLTLAGFTVIRFTRRRVVREPSRVAHTVAELLARLAANPAR